MLGTKPQYLEHVRPASASRSRGLRGRHIGALAPSRAEELRERLKRLGGESRAEPAIRRSTTDSRAGNHRFPEALRHRALDAVITTEKDYVRLPRLTAPGSADLFSAREIEILSGAESWQSCVDRICSAGDDRARAFLRVILREPRMNADLHRRKTRTSLVNLPHKSTAQGGSLGPLGLSSSRAGTGAPPPR